MATLMEVFVDAAINPTRFYSQQLIRRVSTNTTSTIPIWKSASWP